MKKTINRLSLLLSIAVVLTTFTAAAFASTVNPVGVSYSVHVQGKGWTSSVSDGSQAGTTGESLRLEALKIKLTGDVPAGAGISYQVHVQQNGWVSPVSKDGAIAGTTGESKRLEAITITLNNMPGYSVEYRVHVQNIGWTGWGKDGAIAGTTGRSLRMEAIEIRIAAVKVNTVSIASTMDLLEGGEPGKLTATFDPVNAVNKNVTWSSNNSASATVVNGIVTPKTAGKATITVTTEDGGKTAACLVTVRSNYIAPTPTASPTITESPAPTASPVELNSMTAITGTLRVGRELKAGTVTPAGATVSYQWQRAAAATGTYSDITGATAATYTLTADDTGKYIRVSATGTGYYVGTVNATTGEAVVSADYVADAAFFTTDMMDNTLTITLHDGTFKAAPITSDDFTFGGSNIYYFSSAETVIRISDTEVMIILDEYSHLRSATDNTVFVKAQAQATPATTVTASSSASASNFFDTKGTYNTVSVTLENGTFKNAPITADDFIFTGPDSAAIAAAATFTRTADDLVIITGLGAFTGSTDNRIIVKPSAQVTPPSRVDAYASENFFMYGTSGAVITDYDTAGGTSVTLPARLGGVEVTTVGARAFFAKFITSLTIPGNITTIEEEGFEWNLLTSLYIPGTVKTIGANAFEINRSLTTVTLVDGIQNIGAQAFLNCNTLTSITIGRSVAIGDSLINSDEATKRNFRDAYLASNAAAGTYTGTQYGTWTRVIG